MYNKNLVLSLQELQVEEKAFSDTPNLSFMTIHTLPCPVPTII